MDGSNKSTWEEAQEYWETAIRLWKESGLPIREFCRRERLTEKVFYAWERVLRAKNAVSEANQESSCESGDEVVIDGGRRRKQAQLVTGDQPEATTPFIELVAPTPSGFSQCTLELENTNGAKMRIELRSSTMPDVAAISQSFWNHG
jgi:hypothetical protein